MRGKQMWTKLLQQNSTMRDTNDSNALVWTLSFKMLLSSNCLGLIFLQRFNAACGRRRASITWNFKNIQTEYISRSIVETAIFYWVSIYLCCLKIKIGTCEYVLDCLPNLGSYIFYLIIFRVLKLNCMS